MILFDKLWQTMQERGITQYDLYTKYNMNRAQLHRLRHNQNIETFLILQIKFSEHSTSFIFS